MVFMTNFTLLDASTTTVLLPPFLLVSFSNLAHHNRISNIRERDLKRTVGGAHGALRKGIHSLDAGGEC